jgi:hypothetical protein
LKVAVAVFIAMVMKFVQARPKYKLGCRGFDFCDCIGMVIGALRKAGLVWQGIHGSNYAARYRLQGGIRHVRDVSDLQVGYLVFKGNTNPATAKLPNRYKPGESMYNGDLTDYYHVGVVTSINPLVISHMTSPTVKQDRRLGDWQYYGLCQYIDYATPAPEPQPTPVYPTATVYAPTGKTVNLRKGAGKNYGVIERVPIGEIVEILTPGLDWCRVQYRRNVGYMMTQFLVQSTGKEAA